MKNGATTVRRSDAPDWLFASNEAQREMRHNSLLREDEWKSIDDAVIRVAEERLVIVSDLRAAGLVRTLAGLGVLMSEFEKVSDMTAADRTMSGHSKGEEDTPEFDSQSVPIPVIFKNFRIMRRFLEASRMKGQPLDTMATEMATRTVTESLEDMVFNGSTIQLGGNTIPGLLNYADRQPYTISTAWDAVTANTTILADVLAMIQLANNVNYYGPFNLYVPGNWGSVMYDDYDASSGDGRTVIGRLEQIPAIRSVRISDVLTDSNVLLVQMTSNVIDLAVGSDINVVDRQIPDEFMTKMKVFAAMAPRLKSDTNGSTGIVHGS